MRIDTIYISANSFLYDLRVASSLLKDDNALMLPDQAATANSIIQSMIRRIEDASEILLIKETSVHEPEEGLGSAPVQRDRPEQQR